MGLIGQWVLLDAEVYQSEEGPDSKVWRCRLTICWWRLCFRSSGQSVRCLLPSRLLCLLLNAAFYLLLKQTMKHDSSPIYLFLGESLLVGKESYILKKLLKQATDEKKSWNILSTLSHFNTTIKKSNVTSVKLGHVATQEATTHTESKLAEQPRAQDVKGHSQCAAEVVFKLDTHRPVLSVITKDHRMANLCA